jgi:hypothetical protein
VLTAGGFELPVQDENGTALPPSALRAMESADAGPAIPRLTAAQLAALTGAGGGMPLPDRNPKR